MQKFSMIPYVRPDLSAYKEEVKAHVLKVRNAKNYEELRKEWISHSEKTMEVMTMRSVASIRNTVDTTDAFYDAEIRYFNAEFPAISLIAMQAEEALLSSPFVKDFENEFGTILIQNMRASMRFQDERLVPLQIRESELVRRYSKASATATTEFNGKTVNFYGLLKQMESENREIRKSAFNAWSDLYRKISGELDDIYDEMVALRTEMAKTLGFESYTDMAYLKRRRFDYGRKEVQSFHDQVKKYITPACSMLFDRQRQRLGLDRLYKYDESLVFAGGNADPEGTKDELVQKALAMYKELSSETGEFFSFMVEYELFDLESKPGKRPGGYCTSLPMYKAPFIFSNFNGTAADMGVLTHEAGHAFEGYLAGRIQPLYALAHSTSEINEIHSMAMEHFTYPWMKNFFGEKTDMYLYDHLWGALNVIPYMCVVDEFQHRVYDNPGMNRMERRKVWREIEKEFMPWRDYDGNEFLEEGGFWMQKQHIFMYPFYYIEYALAQICAFQFYLKMLKDRETAWNDYVRLCKAGGSMGYFDLLKLANLENPFTEKAVKDAVQAVISELDNLEKRLGI
ncbi:MAG: M3 family oligoendopeptidase [Clostridia bacterium]|nr:M3 family oligoendopeptidase [Clostridia bacterium]MBQ5771278.1 M3 family oligoendopeptidase [Clostridia bacterium]